MTIETLGQAWRAGWQIEASCAQDRLTWHRPFHECRWQRPLDMVTLVASRGEAFPLPLLGSRLRCPECGGRKVTVLFHIPGREARSKA